MTNTDLARKTLDLHRHATAPRIENPDYYNDEAAYTKHIWEHASTLAEVVITQAEKIENLNFMHNIDVQTLKSLSKQVGELTIKPCPHIVSNPEGTQYCFLAYDAVQQLKESNAQLLAALQEARDVIEDWSICADPYSELKQNLDGTIAKCDAIARSVKDGE